MPRLGKRATNAPDRSVGILAMACQHRKIGATREALAVDGTNVQPDTREGQAGRHRVAERLVVLMKPGNAGGGKGP